MAFWIFSHYMHLYLLHPSLTSQADEWELSCVTTCMRLTPGGVIGSRCMDRPHQSSTLCVPLQAHSVGTLGVSKGCHWLRVGHVACALHQAHDALWDTCRCSTALRAALFSYQQRAELLQDVTRTRWEIDTLASFPGAQ